MDGAVRIRGTVVQDELVVALVLLARQLIDVVLAPDLEALGFPGSEACPHGEARLGEVHRLLVLVSHWLRAAPFASLRPHPRAERLRAERPRTKKAPVPTAGTKRLKAAVRDTVARHPRSTTQRAEIRLTRLARHGDQSRWRLLAAGGFRETWLASTPALFGPRLRGDVRLGAAVGFHHPHIALAAVTELLVPITAFLGMVARTPPNCDANARNCATRNTRKTAVDDYQPMVNL